MKKLLAIALLAPSLVFGKSVTFTPIGENIPEIAKGALYLNEVSPNGKKAIIKYFEKQNMNKNFYKIYSWDLTNGLSETEYDWRYPIILGNDSVTYKSIDPSTNTPKPGFIYKTELETIEVTPEDIPNDFFSNDQYISAYGVNAISLFGESGLTGIATGPGRKAAFTWSKDDGFTNPNYQLPICNSIHCTFTVTLADKEGKGFAGSIRSRPVYLNLQSGEERLLEKYNYEHTFITFLTSNGNYAITRYADNYLDNTTGVYDVNQNTTTLLPPHVQYDWVFGNRSWSVELKSITDDGQLAVGKAGQYAVIWTPHSGTKKLSEYITSKYEVDLQGWTLTAATHVSANGQYIYGEGKTAGGAIRVWRLELNRVCETPNW